MKLLDGKEASSAILNRIREKVAANLAGGLRPPHLVAVLVGNDGASETYVASKVRTCENIGFKSTLIRFENSVTEAELIKCIQKINTDPEIDGLIVQSPIPSHISFNRITETISPAKDVDGFHPLNTGRMVQNSESIIAATPKGILMLLEHFKIDTTGKLCVILGRSNIVGMPMSVLMARNSWPGNCTVTLCHSKTPDPGVFTRQADIIIAAIGRPGFLKADMVKEGAIVIDVGISRIADDSRKSGYRLSGDVDFEHVAPKCSYITPVPGGVGLMTIAGLMHNTLIAAGYSIN
ncbi:MAG TPA: tetrahydrofolate dehydrogenase/cyclohydrolase catalytic domain-containing protein [Bacteroidia bacterium]|nr:tetrahydrofolate dehydrogenase/cyclohydrolase catalytic domain-containing protein [Bacteroidia bacterium]